MEWLTFSRETAYRGLFTVKLYNDGQATISRRSSNLRIRYLSWNNTGKYFAFYDREYFLSYKDFGNGIVKFGYTGGSPAYMQLDLASPIPEGYNSAGEWYVRARTGTIFQGESFQLHGKQRTN